MNSNTPQAEVRGTGEATHPPDALERVRREIEACTDPARRRELQAVYDELLRR